MAFSISNGAASPRFSDVILSKYFYSLKVCLLFFQTRKQSRICNLKNRLSTVSFPGLQIPLKTWRSKYPPAANKTLFKDMFVPLLLLRVVDNTPPLMFETRCVHMTWHISHSMSHSKRKCNWRTVIPITAPLNTKKNP